jgi:zinc transporter
MLPGLAWAYCFDRNGCAEEQAIDQPIADRHDGWMWLHFDLNDPRVPQSVQSISSLPVTAKELLLATDEHQQIHADNDCVYGMFAGLNGGPDNTEREIGFIHFAMNEKLLVSSRHGSAATVETARQSLTEDRKIVRVGALLEAIIEKVVDTVDDYAEALAAELDRIEESITAGELADQLPVLGNIRRTTVRLHRQTSMSQLLILRFERDISPKAPPALRLATKKLGQHIEWLDGQIVALRERAHLLQEEVMLRTADDTNRHLQVLAIVATVFLPATLIAGVFGMNVKGLPLTDNPLGFVWSMALLIGTSALVFWWLKRSGILK